MLIILSPAKSLNFKEESPTNKYSYPLFKDKTKALIEVLRNFSPNNLCELMKISNGLGELNYLRYQKWEIDHSLDNSKQAIFAFNGEVYNGLKAHNLNTEQILFTQKHLRVLSGLYGILSPLDLIQPYRLEFGTKLEVSKFKNLYQFWGDTVSNEINRELEKKKSKTLINLASKEYSKAAILKNIKGEIITPVFKQFKGNSCKVITVYAKKARGLMTRFIIENKITNPEKIKLFDTEGYMFNDILSSESEWVFTR